jgi:hypothetical protein
MFEVSVDLTPDAVGWLITLVSAVVFVGIAMPETSDHDSCKQASTGA